MAAVGSGNGGGYDEIPDMLGSAEQHKLANDEPEIVHNNSIHHSFQTHLNSAAGNGAGNTAGNAAQAQAQVAVGSIVEFERNGQWLKARVDHVYGNGKVYVTVLNKDSSSKEAEVYNLDISDIRLGSAVSVGNFCPPKLFNNGKGHGNNGSSGSRNAALAAASDEEKKSKYHNGNNGNNSKSKQEKEIHEFARELWRTLNKIEVKTIADCHEEPIRGFSGKELVKHVKKHLKTFLKSSCSNNDAASFAAAILSWTAKGLSQDRTLRYQTHAPHPSAR